MSDEITICSDCGTTNKAARSFCVTCGVPLWVPEKQITTPGLPADALDTWKNAIEEWRNALRAGEPDLLFWGHIASLLTLAISYAGTRHFPRAHAHLAIILLTLERDAEAEREANIALQQNPNESRAQQVRVALALNKAISRGERFSNSFPFLHRRAGSLCARSDTNQETSVKKASVTPARARDVRLVRSDTSNLIAELEKMLAIFNFLCDTNTNVDEYLNIADFLIVVGDRMRRIPFADWRAKLYDVVANTPTDKLNCPGREQEVEEIRQRARIGSLLFDLKPERRVSRRKTTTKPDSLLKRGLSFGPTII